MDLSRYSNTGYSRGASRLKETAWIVLNETLVTSGLPGSGWRVRLLRLFGARIGTNVVVKPRVRVKFPWRLNIGDHSWIGEAVWIDNLAEVSIGSSACISQGAYFCTGSHNWSRETFDLITHSITVADKVWVGAFAKLCPGAIIGEGAVVQIGGVAAGELLPWRIYGGARVAAVGLRKVESGV